MYSASASREATIDEALLIQRLLARDEQAMRLLYVRYAKTLLAVVLRLVHDEASPQDVLQEAWLKVWFSIVSYDAERGRLFTWMARLCSNHAVGVLHSRRHQFHRQNRSLEGAGAERVPAPASFKLEHVGVRELTGQLKPRQREAIVDAFPQPFENESEAIEWLRAGQARAGAIPPEAGR